MLSPIHLENLRDGIEDYEMLGLLQERVGLAKAQGKNMAAVERLLAIDEKVCRADLTYTSNPAVLAAARRQIAQCLVQLGGVELEK